MDDTENIIEEFFPVRCRTCGKVISQYERPYKKFISEGKLAKDFFDALKLRSCCRTEMLCPQKISMAPRLPDYDTFRIISETTKQKTQTESEEKATNILKTLSMLTQGKKAPMSGQREPVEQFTYRKPPYFAV